MSISQRLIVFARAPRSGQVKTRLARDIGDAAALSFYEQCLASVLDTSRRGPWRLEVHVAGSDDVTHPLFDGLSVAVQSGGDIGHRMCTALAAQGAEDRVLIGSDIPDIRVRHIASAFAALAHHDLVFGPASDGGFWLVGCRAGLVLPADFMQAVRWSSPHALADTLAPLSSSLRIAHVDTLTDVDDGASFRAVAARAGNDAEHAHRAAAQTDD